MTCALNVEEKNSSLLAEYTEKDREQERGGREGGGTLKKVVLIVIDVTCLYPDSN